jgi:predicted nucleic acid-binding protein
LDSLLVDAGFLIALGRQRDPLHEKAKSFLRSYSGKLVTVSPVIVETCFFFDSMAKLELLEWVHIGGMAVAEVPVPAYPDVADIIRKYNDRPVDFADAALVWLAGESGLRRILTVDERDFGVYRLKGGKRFEVISWMR